MSQEWRIVPWQIEDQPEERTITRAYEGVLDPTLRRVLERIEGDEKLRDGMSVKEMEHYLQMKIGMPPGSAKRLVRFMREDRVVPIERRQSKGPKGPGRIYTFFLPDGIRAGLALGVTFMKSGYTANGVKVSELVKNTKQALGTDELAGVIHFEVKIKK